MKCKANGEEFLVTHDFIVTSWQTNGDLRHATQFLCQECLCFMSPEDIHVLGKEYEELKEDEILELEVYEYGDEGEDEDE